MTLTKRTFLTLSAAAAASSVLPITVRADETKFGCCGILIALLAIREPGALGKKVTVQASRSQMKKANAMKNPEDAGRYLAAVLGQKALKKSPKAPANMGDAIFKAMQRGGHCKSGKKNFQDLSVTRYLDTGGENWRASVSMQSDNAKRKPPGESGGGAAAGVDG